MPDYLQRVAQAGARTGSAIRPPAVAPPLVPAGVIPAEAALRNAGLEETIVVQAQDVPSPAPPLAARQTGEAAIPTSAAHDLVAPPSAAAEQAQQRPAVVLPGASTAARSVVQAPKGLRGEPPSPVARSHSKAKPLPGQEPPLTSGPTFEHARSVESALLRPAEEASAAPAHIKREMLPAVPGRQGSLHETTVSAASPETVARSVPSGMPAGTPQQEMASSAHVVHSETTAPVQVKRSAAPFADVPAEANVAPPSTAAPGAAGQSVEVRVQPRVVQSAAAASVPALTNSTAIAVPAAKVMPLPASPGSRQNQINIGRIEVQVNNQAPPVARTEPVPSVKPAGVDSWEGRSLNRFAIKP